MSRWVFKNYENGISEKVDNRNYEDEPNKNYIVEKYNNQWKNLLEGFKQFSINLKIVKSFSDYDDIYQ